MPGLHALPEIAQRGEGRFEPFEHMARELLEMLPVLLDAVEDRRLDVRDDEAVVVVEKAALDDLLRQS